MIGEIMKTSKTDDDRREVNRSIMVNWEDDGRQDVCCGFIQMAIQCMMNSSYCVNDETKTI